MTDWVTPSEDDLDGIWTTNLDTQAGCFPGEEFPRCLQCLRPSDAYLTLRPYVLPVDEEPCDEDGGCRPWEDTPSGRLRYGALKARVLRASLAAMN